MTSVIITPYTNQIPSIANQIPDQTANENALFNYTVPANTFSDADNFPNASLTLTALLADNSALPTWLSFSNGIFSGTPANGDIGTISVKVTATDGESSISDVFTLTVDAAVAVPWEAHVNFQNKAVTPPTGYDKDYGKEFGNATITINSIAYDYGWKNQADNQPIDASEDLAANGTGVGRNRLGSTANYNSATDTEKLEGTLVHFQGDNVLDNTGGGPKLGVVSLVGMKYFGKLKFLMVPMR